jgi:hypothetical protein
MHLWDTLGAQVALNLAPLLHRTFPLALRAEVGVSGFVALDLFRMLAEDQCRKMKAPTGSTFWAAQTVVNMQSCCLAGILVTITKDEAFSPWRAGSARMSEISIEEQFSFLRRQSANAQLIADHFGRQPRGLQFQRAESSTKSSQLRSKARSLWEWKSFF